MLRIFGVILICISTAMMGMSAGKRVHTRSKVLSEFISALDLMITEISCLLTPIEEILEKLVKETPEPIRGFFYQCLSARRTKEEARFQEIWLKELKSAEFLCLSEVDIALLSEIGNSFGKYSGEEQVRVMKGIQRKLVKLQATAQEECMKNGRLYRSLGITCGIALVILLI